MRIIKVVPCILFALSLVLSGCKVTNQNLSTKWRVNKMIKLYAALLEESQLFMVDEKKHGFSDSLQDYIKNCKDYDFSNHVRMESYVCQPILLNEKHDKVIVMILSRKLDLGNNRVEYINYVSGKLQNDKWIFKVYTVRSDTFGYYENYPTLSDTEIGLGILGRLIQQKLLNEHTGSTELLFKSDFYVLN